MFARLEVAFPVCDGLPSGETCGNQQLRSFSSVICVCSVPSDFMRHICISPERTEQNQMWRPSGEYSGPSSSPGASVSRVSSPPSDGME